MTALAAVDVGWDAVTVRQALAALQDALPGLAIEIVARTESTNSTLLARARGGTDAGPWLLVAEQQTHGRGRLGRTWIGSAGASLTFSLGMSLVPVDWAGLSLAVGLALADALDAAPEPRLMLKWPNDLWLSDAPGRGRKLGGVLIETVGHGRQRTCIVGVGINVLPQPVAGLAHGYACLHEIDPAVSAPAVLARVVLPLAQALRRFEADGFAPLAAGFVRRDLLLGQPVTTTWPSVPCGVAEGVHESGALRVRSGGLHLVLSGEISVRLQAEAV